MANFDLRISGATTQNFTTLIANRFYRMRLQWNEIPATWTLDISDSNGVSIAAGLTLQPGTRLLAAHPWMPFDLAVVSDEDALYVSSFMKQKAKLIAIQ